MRVQSIISSFVLVLGNFILHFTLAFLAGTVVEPTQEEMDQLASEVPPGTYECVSAADLSDALRKAKNLHWVAFGFLFYVKVHTPIWSRIVGYFRENKICCFQSINLRILDQSEIDTLGEYSEQMKKTLKLIEEGHAEVQVDNEFELLKVNNSVHNLSASGVYSPRLVEHTSSALNISYNQPVQIEEEFRREEANEGEHEMADDADVQVAFNSNANRSAGASNAEQKEGLKAGGSGGAQEISGVEALLKKHKTSHWCSHFSNLKPFQFNMIQVPLLLFYLVTIAQAAEITVKCRSISNKFEHPDAVSLFVFFELEVFAFAGILFGLWIWITAKYYLSSLFTGGPQHVFKTKGVKQAKD